MQISARQQQMIMILLRENNGITIAKIADEIHTSTRTVHRELPEIEPLMEQYGLHLMKRSGVGLILQGAEQDKERLERALERAIQHSSKHVSNPEQHQEAFQVTQREFSPEERRSIILCTLLAANEPIKLFLLAHNLKVAVPTISHDLDQLEEWVRGLQLHLVRRRGYGIELKGTEAAKRKAMMSLLSENLDETQLIGLLKENIQQKTAQRVNSASEQLLGLIQRDRLIAVENTLQRVRNDLPYPLADSSYIALVVHLSLMIERLMKGEHIEIDQHYFEDLKRQAEYKVAKQIINELAGTFTIPFPEAEIAYITMHLQGSKLRMSQHDLLEINNVEVTAVAQKLMEGAGRRLGVNFYEDRSLLSGLLTHLEPAMNRMRRGMHIRNPLLHKIKQDYEQVFKVIAETVKEAFPPVQVPEEEIAYLVLHFGSSMERLKRTRTKYRALIVCSSGIGSSRMLADRIEAEIPEIEVFKHASIFEVHQIDFTKYDLIISTIPVPFEQKPYITVSPLLSREEIVSIRNFLSQVPIEPLNDAKPSQPQTIEKILDHMEAGESYFRYTLTICKGWYDVQLNNQSQDIIETLETICEQLENLGIMRDYRKVVRKLLEREEKSGLGIPGTTQVLYHVKSAEIVQPSFSIGYLQEPIIRRSMDGEEMSVTKLLILVSPQEMRSEGTEILSEISSLLIEEETMNVIENKQPIEIKTYFIEKLKQFCFRKVKERGNHL
ncbi:BglG family transcription antiterminator [Brevibacillus laterosporus]|uniref:BglG family transcription antiterminator n=1 Tax=Brevibacillus laterosporus TaxID=1465 RepID=UPI000EB1D6E9|nr:BglG family transcription antiterminator [Brevibacillus laterosporus]AYK06924.1 PRD domain-containing protein [Brevibacillus laterosporus]